MEHQVCLTHVRKNVAGRLKKLKGWEREKEKIKALMQELPPDGGKELLELEKRCAEHPGCGNWWWTWVRSGVAWYAISGGQGCLGPITGLSKGLAGARSGTTLRGYKSIAGMLNGLHLTQWVWRPQVVADLTALVPA